MAAFPMVPVGLATDVTLGKMVTSSPKNPSDIQQKYVHAANIRDFGVLDMEHSVREMWFTTNEVNSLDVRAGDVFLAEGGASGKPAIALEDIDDCGFQNSVLRVRSDDGKNEPKFLLYAFLSAFLEGEFARLINTVSIAHLPAEKLNRIRIPLPDLATQRRIADYLDAETAQIDTLVAELDGYVELLEKRNKAVIDSLLMGDYPTVSLGLVAESISGLTYKPDEIVTDGGTCVYRSGNVRNSRIDRSDMVRVSTPIPPKLRFEEGDILMCSRNGSAHLVGKNARVESQDLGQSWGAFMTVVRSRFNPFLYWFFRSSAFDAERGNFSTSTINQLTSGILNRISLPLPDLDTQRRIADYLEEETAKTDTIITQCRELKELLLKRRQVLITDVVTGKVEV